MYPMVSLQEYCLKFIVKESNYNQIVMSKEFETLDRDLMVEIIRRRQLPPVRSLQEPHSDVHLGEMFSLLSLHEIWGKLSLNIVWTFRLHLETEQ